MSQVRQGPWSGPRLNRRVVLRCRPSGRAPRARDEHTTVSHRAARRGSSARYDPSHQCVTAREFCRPDRPAAFLAGCWRAPRWEGASKSIVEFQAASLGERRIPSRPRQVPPGWARRRVAGVFQNTVLNLRRRLSGGKGGARRWPRLASPTWFGQRRRAQQQSSSSGSPGPRG